MATTTSSMRVTAPARSFARPRDPLRRSVPRPRASASPASRLASRSIARRHRLVARSGSPFEVATPARTTTELDERDAFKQLMERAGVKHRVRLASGARGRGLFPSGPVGWGKSAVLLSVPLDVCIVAPFGDAAGAAAAAKGSGAVAEELGVASPAFGSGTPRRKDTCGILRAAWEKRAGVRLPDPIVALAASGEGSRRELAVALWVLFATRSGDASRSVWRAYAEWLPTAEQMPSLMLASEKELDQLQDGELKRDARALQARADALFLEGARGFARGGDDAFFDDDVENARLVLSPEMSVDAADARWAFALVASRAVASPVGDDGAFAAILTPFFDMANSDDASLVTASKSVRGTADADVENAARVALERGLNQGVGGPRVVLETARALENQDAEILIAYDPSATNRELMLRYGFSLRGNRNERLPSPTTFPFATQTKKKTLDAEILRFALEATGAATEETSAEERRRLFVAVASACGGFGNPDEDTGEWELDENQVRLELDLADAFAATWRGALERFDTDAARDEAMLAAARAGSLPGATPRVVAAIEYRAERKRCLETGVRALRAYVEWLQADEEEEEVEVEESAGFVDQEE